MFGKIGSVFSKIRSGIEEMKAERKRVAQEKSAKRAKEEAEKAQRRAKKEAERFSSLGMAHEDYPFIYQEDLDATNRCRVFELWNEIWEYFGNAIKTTLGAFIRRPQATMSERFQFDGASFVVTVTSLNVGGKSRTDLYMTVAKYAEYENLLSRENVRQLAASISKSDDVSGNTLGIARADFVKGCNAALLESAHAQDRKPLNYYDRFILDDNAVEELDAEGGRVVYFKLGEKNVRLGCFERENSLAAIFYSSELELRDDRNIDSDSILMLSAVRSFYKGVDLKKISNHLRLIKSLPTPN